MSRSPGELVDALDRVAAAMDAETAAVRRGPRDELAAAAERKRLVIEASIDILRAGQGIAGAAVPAERARLEEAGQRMQAAAQRNAATLQGALEGTRRLFGCLAEAARQASSTGTYAPDGSRRRTEEALGTIQRSA